MHLKIVTFSNEYVTLLAGLSAGHAVNFSPKSYLNRINASAHPYATVVYTALFFGLEAF